MDEIQRTLDVLIRMNAGDYVENILEADNNRTEMNLALFKNAFDLTCPILAGTIQHVATFNRSRQHFDVPK